jgi:tRNA A-37 threonylcarbamoyl transferase component Bud32
MDRIGRYKIVRELGRGAMGVVYHAIDPNIGRPVAIKTIQLGVGRKPEEQERMRERLFREARSAGILSHPGIVTVYDVEQQGDLAYIAMEYVDGPTLDQVLSGEPPIGGDRMFSILGQTAVALDYAHQKGIVHRDIKPANIMITVDGTAKITDFGIAKITASEHLTMTGSIVGTPHYMSPEQVQGHAVDGRSDQFSLAVIAYEMLTGEKPYTGEHLTTVVYKIVAEEPVAPHRLNPTVGGPIEVALRKALAKKPDARYRTCQEMTDALEKACAATKGWKTMPRGGSLNEPTVADAGRSAAAPAMNLPPARRARGGDTTATSQRAAQRKLGFFPFLLAILMAAGLLALIGYQAAPWFSPGGNLAKGTPPEPAAPQTAKAETPAAPAPQTPIPVSAAGPPAAAEEKPSPMPPAKPEDTKPPPEPLEEKPQTKVDQPLTDGRGSVAARGPRIPPNSLVQPVTIISSPGGATATLDGRLDATCTTPCTMDSTTGRHSIAVSMPGYQVERREITVGTGPMEAPAIILRPQGGTLMLTSTPAGAAVLVNGRRVDQVTPAQIALAPGTYTVTIEKDGRQSTQKVEIRNGAMTYQKLVLEQ